MTASERKPVAMVADAYWYVHSQPRDAWTFELDLRPGIEKW